MAFLLVNRVARTSSFLLRLEWNLSRISGGCDVLGRLRSLPVRDEKDRNDDGNNHGADEQDDRDEDLVFQTPVVETSARMYAVYYFPVEIISIENIITFVEQQCILGICKFNIIWA